MLGIASEAVILEVGSVASEPAYDVVWLHQSIAGLPAFEGRLRLSVEPGGVRAMSGLLVPDDGVAHVPPAVSAEEAAAIAGMARPSLGEAGEVGAVLGIDSDGYWRPARLAWRVDDGFGWVVVDAQTGGVIVTSRR
jgi:hypothetical protein